MSPLLSFVRVGIRFVFLFFSQRSVEGKEKNRRRKYRSLFEFGANLERSCRCDSRALEARRNDRLDRNSLANRSNGSVKRGKVNDWEIKMENSLQVFKWQCSKVSRLGILCYSNDNTYLLFIFYIRCWKKLENKFSGRSLGFLSLKITHYTYCYIFSTRPEISWHGTTTRHHFGYKTFHFHLEFWLWRL